MFGRASQPARSTTQILREANEQNIPIYTITPDNMGELLPQLSVSNDVKIDITRAIHAGQQAIVPQRELAVGNWNGTGYILQDLITGAGAYLIDGGYNGGTHDGCEIEQTALVTNKPRLKIIKDALFDQFDEEQVYWQAQLEQAKQLNNQVQVDQITRVLDMGARMFVGLLMALEIEIQLKGEGCFVAQAYGQSDEIQLPLRYNTLGTQQVNVDFSVAQITHCWDHAWQIFQHDAGDTPTVIGTSDQPALTFAFTEEGQYTAEVSAKCKATGAERVESEIDVYIHDKIATTDFCEAATEGNPIHPATGATVEQQTLLSVQGVLPIHFTLQYHSLRLKSGSTGIGWEDGRFGARLEELANDNVRIHWTNNHYNEYNKDADGHYVSPQSDCVFDTLVKHADGRFTLTRNHQVIYQFNSLGLLVKIGNRRGQFLELSYHGDAQLGTLGPLRQVTEPISGVFLKYYYEDGFLTQVLGPLGRQATLSYEQGHLVQMTDAAGQTTHYTYNDNGQLLTKTNAEGVVVSRNTYDSLGRVIEQDDSRSENQLLRLTFETDGESFTTTVKSRDNQKRIYVHDENYKLLRYQDELGHKTYYTYNEQGKRTSVKDAKNRTSHLSYDSNGNLATVTDAAGNVSSFVYSQNHNLLSVTNALGKEIRFSYQNNNLTSITDPLDNVTHYNYNNHGQVLTKTSPSGGVTTYEYQNGFPARITDSEGVVYTLGVDAAGRLTQVSDADNNTTILAFDGINRLVSVKNPLGHTVSMTYDSRNNLLSFTDAKGNVTQSSYDSNGNFISQINALNEETRYEYEGADRLVRVIDAENRVTQLGYDAKGRVVSVTNALGQTQQLEYDAADNLLKQFDAFGRQVMSLKYDKLDNPSDITDANGKTAKFFYDSLNRLIQTKDPNGRVTQFHYDDSNRLVKTFDAIMGQSKQGFDATARLAHLTDAKGNERQFDFDLSGRLVQETSATNDKVSYTYSARDLLVSVTNGRSQQRRFEYDAAGRLTRWTDPDGTVSYIYDANDNVLTVSDENGTITREYDPLNRVTKYTDTQGNTLQYTYNSAGNLVTLAYPDGRQVHYEYNATNQLVLVRDWAGRVTGYDYDKNGRLISVLRPNGTHQTRVYDDAGQLLQQKDVVISSGEVISQFDFSYDAAGNITQELVTPPPKPLQFTTPVKMSYTLANRLASYNEESVQFDADGNMVFGPLSGGMANFSFDSRNRLMSAGNTVYRYDAENQRIGVSVSGQETRYVINSQPALSQVLVRTQPDETQTYYVYGLGLIGQEQNGEYLTYHFDFRGSTVALTDENAQITERFQYSPYGLLVNGDALATPFLFNGKYGVMTDSNGLYYMRARYYNHEIRRFVNQDVLLGNIVEGQGLNRYAYVTGQPVSFVDPFGLIGIMPTWTEEQIYYPPESLSNVAIVANITIILMEISDAGSDAIYACSLFISGGTSIVALPLQQLKKATLAQLKKKLLKIALSEAKKFKKGKISIVLDKNTGEVFRGLSGTPYPEDVNKLLKKQLPQKSQTHWEPLNCAEPKACNDALNANADAKLDEDLIMLTIELKHQRPVKRCDNCLISTDGVNALTDKKR